jgi:hypothetical protein
VCRAGLGGGGAWARPARSERSPLHQTVTFFWKESITSWKKRAYSITDEECRKLIVAIKAIVHCPFLLLEMDENEQDQLDEPED